MAEHGESGRRVVAIGECMIELKDRTAGELSYGFAGDTLNVATYLRRLLPRAAFAVDYVTALGDDPLSGRMLAAWEDEGIGTGFVRRLPGELPGIYWIGRAADGDRLFHYWRERAAARQLFATDEPVAPTLQSGDLLYFSAISLAILPPPGRTALLALARQARRAGATVACDGNFRPRLWPDLTTAREVYSALLGSVDVFLTSFPDEAALHGDVAIEDTGARLHRAGVMEWLVRGEPGATLGSATGLAHVRPSAAGTVVDTTGAGDAFDAAYLAARLLDRVPAVAVSAGHALAGVVVQHPGAIIEPALTPGLDTLLG